MESAYVFDNWCKQWMQTYIKPTVKPTTFYTTYQIPVRKHLIPYFQQRQLASIAPLDVQAFFNCKGETYSLEYLSKFRALLKKIFDAAIDNGLCCRSPVTNGLRLHSTIHKCEKHIWNKQQYDIVWEYAKHHKFGLTILTLMETAISRSELLGLQWKDFDSNNKLLYINQGLVECNTDNGRITLCDGLKNDHRHRVIPISSELNAYLSLSSMRNFPCNYLRKFKHIFCNSDGQPYMPTLWYEQVFRKFMCDLSEEYPGIPILTPHELRHTKATLLIYDNTDPYTVARLLGHRDLSMMSKIYLHDDTAAMRTSLKLQ